MLSRWDLLFLGCVLRRRMMEPAQFAEVVESLSGSTELAVDTLLSQRGLLSEADRAEIEAEVRLRMLAESAGADEPAESATRETAVTSAPPDTDLAHGPSDAETMDVPTSGEETLALEELKARLSDPPPSRERYEARTFHAEGGIGQIWLVRDENIGRDVALKELKGSRKVSPAYVARFLREGRITGQLEHPGIVPVYDIAQSRGDRDLFYTMRFVKGRTLAQAVREFHETKGAASSSTMNFVGLLNAFVSVCQAVAYAHSRGVIHRDIKGQNVVLGDFGEVILLDWGLAKVLGTSDPDPGPSPAIVLDPGSSGEETGGGEVLGTPAYMAPEQASADQDATSERTDVYGLGAMLYTILTGRAPFSGATVSAILEQVRTKQPAAPRTIIASTPPAIQAICLKAMAKKPEDRYASAQELARDVQRFLADEPVSVHRDAWTTRLIRWTRHHKPAAAAVAALLATGVVALAVSRYLIGIEQRQTQEARLTAEANLSLARETIDRMLVRMLDERLPHIPRMEAMRVDVARAALDGYAQLGTDPLKDPETVWRSLQAGRFAANIFRLTGDLETAAATYRSTLDQGVALYAAAPARPEDQLQQAMTRIDLAGLLMLAGDLPGAEREHRQGLAEAAAIAEDATVADNRRRALGMGRNDLAFNLLERGRRDEAITLYREAEAELAPLARRAPPDAIDTALHCFTLVGQARTLRELGRVLEARPLLSQALEAARSQAQADPTHSDIQATLVSIMTESARLLVGQPEERARADAELGEAIEIARGLVRDYPSVPYHREDLAWALIERGKLRATQGAVDAGRSDLEEAVATLEAVVDEFPQYKLAPGDLGVALSELGRLNRATGRDNAREVLERAVGRLEGALKVTPGRVEVIEQLRLAREALGEAPADAPS